MKHMQTLKLNHPSVMKLMDDIESLNKLIDDHTKKIRDLSHRRNRLEAIATGKASELFEDIQMIYGIEEPEDGFELQFHFKKHLVRLIQSHNPYEEAMRRQAEENEKWNEKKPDHEIDWDNPEEVAEYNEKRSKDFEKHRKGFDDGIDWETKKKDEDDTPPPEATNV